MISPLKNRSILITRDKEQAASLATIIKAQGGKPSFLPVICIEATNDWNPCDEVLTRVKNYDWIVFSSVNSVNYFLKRAAHKNIKKLKNHLAAIGDKTVSLLKEYGYNIDLQPKQASARDLIKSFSEVQLKGQRVLIPGSNIIRPELKAGLEEYGAQVDSIVVYHNRTNTRADTKKTAAMIKQKRLDAITFFSPSAVNGFVNLMGKTMISEITTSQIALVAIGATTAQALKKQKLPSTIIAQKRSAEGLVQSMAEYFSNTLNGVSADA